MIQMTTISNDTPQEGFVLELETDSKISLVRYSKKRKGLTDLKPEVVEVFEKDELIEIQVFQGEKSLLNFLGHYTKGKDVFIREEIADYMRF